MERVFSQRKMGRNMKKQKKTPLGISSAWYSKPNVELPEKKLISVIAVESGFVWKIYSDGSAEREDATLEKEVDNYTTTKNEDLTTEHCTKEQGFEYISHKLDYSQPTSKSLDSHIQRVKEEFREKFTVVDRGRLLLVFQANHIAVESIENFIEQAIREAANGK